MSNQIDLLWDILPHPSNEHVVRLFWRGAGEERGGDYARNKKELERFIDNTVGYNVYLAPNPTTSTIGMRHSASDVTHWSYFLIDVDPLASCAYPDPQPVMDRSLSLLREWLSVDRLDPILIDSGRGMQAWLRLQDRPFDSVNTRVRARKAMGYWLKRLSTEIGLQNGCKIDTSTSDLPRLMRCPTTHNTKTGRKASILSVGGGKHEGLDDLLCAFVPDQIYAEPEPGLYQQGRKWQIAFSDLTRTAQSYLQRGHEEPGRHKAMWHTARKLAEVGVERSETFRAIVRANSLMGPDNELPVSEIERALDKVYEQAP